MLYLSISILIIAAGLILLIYSFITEPEIKSIPVNESIPDREYSSKRPEKAEFSEKTEAGITENVIKTDYNNAINGEKITERYRPVTEELHSKDDKDFPDLATVYDKDINIDFLQTQEMIDDKETSVVKSETVNISNEREYHATLYEDSSNVLDYDNNTSVIDPTLNEYKKIRRKGKGTIEVKGSGINFYIDNKFFRFDFHRIENIKRGDNFIALFVKGSDIVRLFLFEEKIPSSIELK